jgi:L-lactate dehydrogenase complex protein LldG
VTTRGEFLGRIRREMSKTSGRSGARVADRPVRPADVAETIRRELAERWPETLGRFRHEFEKVGGDFHRVAAGADVAEVVAAIARGRQARTVVAWHSQALGIADLGAELTARGLSCESMPDGAVDGAEGARLRARVAAADLGLTGVDLAVAETGTLVLRSGPGRPRSTSLLPPYHIAVFDRTALVESLAQLGVWLEAWHAPDADPGSGAVINLITGPSRTADIELTLTRGVHGPKEVHAIFVENGVRTSARG